MAAIHFVPAAAYVLLLSLSLVGSIAGGQYYPRSAGATHDSFEAVNYWPQPKPAVQWVPKPEELKKPKSFTFPTFGQDPKTDYYKPELQPRGPSEKPKIMRPEPVKPQTNGYGPKKLEEDAYPIAVEGTVICKSGSEYVPIKGAVVRITCWGVEEKEEGYNSYKAAPLAWKTRPTDANGYFFKTLHSNSVQNFVEKCKAYIERSPMKNCSAASDVNKGITGSPLSSYRILHDKRIKLYPVGPFFYTPSYQSPKSTPAGY